MVPPTAVSPAVRRSDREKRCMMVGGWGQRTGWERGKLSLRLSSAAVALLDRRLESIRVGIRRRGRGWKEED